jgi:predicted Fe-Mo cluster-binding NifX family protein
MLKFSPAYEALRWKLFWHVLQNVSAVPAEPNVAFWKCTLFCIHRQRRRTNREKGLQAAHLLVGENVDVVLAASLGEGPFHVLGDSIIQIYHLSDSVNIRDAVLLLNQNLLKIMESPIEKHENDEIE